MPWRENETEDCRTDGVWGENFGRARLFFVSAVIDVGPGRKAEKILVRNSVAIFYVFTGSFQGSNRSLR